MNYPKPIPSTTNLSSLIEALTIIRKYNDPEFPTNCQHDVLFVEGPSPSSMEWQDVDRLTQLGFVWPEQGGDYDGGWISFRFGNC
jgi:hypothetical protein